MAKRKRYGHRKRILEQLNAQRVSADRKAAKSLEAAKRQDIDEAVRSFPTGSAATQRHYAHILAVFGAIQAFCDGLRPEWESSGSELTFEHWLTYRIPLSKCERFSPGGSEYGRFLFSKSLLEYATVNNYINWIKNRKEGKEWFEEFLARVVPLAEYEKMCGGYYPVDPLLKHHATAKQYKEWCDHKRNDDTVSFEFWVKWHLTAENSWEWEHYTHCVAHRPVSGDETVPFCAWVPLEGSVKKYELWREARKKATKEMVSFAIWLQLWKQLDEWRSCVAQHRSCSLNLPSLWGSFIDWQKAGEPYTFEEWATQFVTIENHERWQSEMRSAEKEQEEREREMTGPTKPHFTAEHPWRWRERFTNRGR